MEKILLISFFFFLIATLYSTVGHAGASGYLAVMGLLSFSPESIKPTSLVLNIIVALIASIKFIREGYFDKKIFKTFVITSVPMAYIGGTVSLSPMYFKLLAGMFLVISAFLLLIRNTLKTKSVTISPMPQFSGSVLGLIIGFFSGLIGVGGGIFLSPILILLNWADIQKASGVAALFILFNSMSGLSGHLNSVNNLDHNLGYWSLAVVLGGITGSYLGTKKFNKKVISIFLFIVLMSAGIKFIFVDFFFKTRL